MNIENLKALEQQLVSLTETVTTSIKDIEEKGKIRHREYSDIRQSAQEIKKVAQSLRVEVLTQFKGQNTPTQE